MDQPFLLADSPGEASRLLNKAASLEDIDLTISALKGQVTKVADDLKNSRTRLVNYTEQLVAYRDLDQLESMIMHIERLGEDTLQKQMTSNQLQRLIGAVDRVISLLRKSDNLPSWVAQIDALRQSYEALQGKAEACESVRKMLSRVKDIQGKIGSSLYLESTIGRVEEALSTYTLLMGKKDTHMQLRALFAQIEKGLKRVDELHREIENAAGEFARISPDACPLCDAPMKKGVR